MRFAAMLLLASVAFAQNYRGRVQGTVTDSSAAVVAGAKVSLLDVNKGIETVRETSPSGQFLFDLLEWEDFMLDGPAPPTLDGPALQLALARLTDSLRALSAALGGQPAPATVTADVPGAGLELPELESSFYMYPDVVLGVLALLTQAGERRA